ncbi:unnamed protein product, partial [Polarella glacialis]
VNESQVMTASGPFSSKAITVRAPSFSALQRQTEEDAAARIAEIVAQAEASIARCMADSMSPTMPMANHNLGSHWALSEAPLDDNASSAASDAEAAAATVERAAVGSLRLSAAIAGDCMRLKRNVEDLKMRVTGLAEENIRLRAELAIRPRQSSPVFFLLGVVDPCCCCLCGSRKPDRRRAASVPPAVTSWAPLFARAREPVSVVSATACPSERRAVTPPAPPPRVGVVTAAMPTPPHPQRSLGTPRMASTAAPHGSSLLIPVPCTVQSRQLTPRGRMEEQSQSTSSGASIGRVRSAPALSRGPPLVPPLGPPLFAAQPPLGAPVLQWPVAAPPAMQMAAAAREPQTARTGRMLSASRVDSTAYHELSRSAADACTTSSTEQRERHGQLCTSPHGAPP